MKNLINYIRQIKITKTIKIIVVIISLSVFYSVLLHIVINNRNKIFLKPFVSFIAKYSLSDNCDKRSGCNELRPIPKILQNKKIVFDRNINIKFDPYEDINNMDLSELDILGFLDTEPLFNKEKENFIDPTLNKRGFLEAREYKIIRAVYSYKCLYCIDSSDLAYLVLEDFKGNKFMVFLQTYDSSVEPPRDFLWDEYIPYFLSKDSNDKEILYARLEDI